MATFPDPSDRSSLGRSINSRETLQNLRKAGPTHIMRHDWFKFIGSYYRENESEDAEWMFYNGQTMSLATARDMARGAPAKWTTYPGRTTSREGIRREAEAIRSAGLKYFLYIGYSNIGLGIVDLFQDSLIRDADGVFVLTGYDWPQHHHPNVWVNPDPEFSYAQSIFAQIDALCALDYVDGIYVDGLARIDNHERMGLWDRGHKDGSAAPLDHYEKGVDWADLPPAASLDIAGRKYLTDLKKIISGRGKNLICNSCRSIWVAQLADAFQTEMHINPVTMLMAKCLGNGKGMSIKGNVTGFAKHTQTVGLARNVCALLTQNYPAPQTCDPHISPFTEKLNLRPQRLLGIISSEDGLSQVWIFPSAISRLRFSDTADHFPDNLDGSSVTFLPSDEGEIRRLEVTDGKVVVDYHNGTRRLFEAVHPEEYDENYLVARDENQAIGL